SPVLSIAKGSTTASSRPSSIIKRMSGFLIAHSSVIEDSYSRILPRLIRATERCCCMNRQSWYITGMKKKTPYRIRNWPGYNAALIGRGSLTLWVDEEAIRSSRYSGPTQRGAQYHYVDTAISCVLTLRAVYPLALRAAEGLARSVFALLAVSLPVPSYSTLSRRAA